MNQRGYRLISNLHCYIPFFWVVIKANLTLGEFTPRSSKWIISEFSSSVSHGSVIGSLLVKCLCLWENSTRKLIISSSWLCSSDFYASTKDFPLPIFSIPLYLVYGESMSSQDLRQRALRSDDAVEAITRLKFWDSWRASSTLVHPIEFRVHFLSFSVVTF